MLSEGVRQWNARLFSSADGFLGTLQPEPLNIISICNSHTKGHARVAADLSLHAIKSVQSVSSRNPRVSLKMHVGTLDVISTYVPPSCHTNPELANQHYHELRSLIEDSYTSP